MADLPQRDFYLIFYGGIDKGGQGRRVKELKKITKSEKLGTFKASHPVQANDLEKGAPLNGPIPRAPPKRSSAK